jgi:hypothetical protein
MYKALVESVSTYGAKVWTVSKENGEELKAMDMNFWSSCGLTKLDRVRNEELEEGLKST